MYCQYLDKLTIIHDNIYIIIVHYSIITKFCHTAIILPTFYSGFLNLYVCL